MSREQLIKALRVQWNALDPVDPFRDDIAAAADMLEADGAQQGEQQPVAWQPIETAPKDGTHILVCKDKNADGEPMGDSFGIFVQRAAWWEGEGWVVYCDLVREPQCFFEPSHWMPLPQAPREAAPAVQPELSTCNCRWDGETQVQQCTLHEAHVDAIHEWAERAKTAEKASNVDERILGKLAGLVEHEVSIMLLAPTAEDVAPIIETMESPFLNQAELDADTSDKPENPFEPGTPAAALAESLGA